MTIDVYNMETAESQTVELSENVSRMRGYIRYEDNPLAIHSSIVAMSSYGVPPEDVKIIDNAAQLLEDLTTGDTLVVKGLDGLNTNDRDIVDILVTIMESGASVVCLDDSELRIDPESTELLRVLRMVKSHRSGAWTRGPRRCEGRHAGRPDGSVSADQQAKYDEALRIYRAGGSMQQATRIAGCNYSSFWYWYNKQVLQRKMEHV